METSVQRWGNSSAIRLPKPVLRTAEISEKDTVQIIARKNEIVIKKHTPGHRTFRERMENYRGVYEAEELGVAPVGDERFWEHE
jgi:antitoxin MazE